MCFKNLRKFYVILSKFSMDEEEDPLIEKDLTTIAELGSSSFSTVYHVKNKNGHEFVLKKIFFHLSPVRIVKEMTFLNNLDHPNISKILYAYRNGDQATLVMDYFKNTKFNIIIQHPTERIIKLYMHGLLSALAYLDSKHIIHRDIKPPNYLFDPDTGKGCLIDFGLSQEYHPLNPVVISQDPDELDDHDNFQLEHPEECKNLPKMIANRAGTRGYRAPEVLMSYFDQSPKIDVWASGVILLSFLSQRYPFFNAHEDLLSLYELSLILGTQSLKEAAAEIGRKVKFPDEHEKPDLRQLIRKINLLFDEIQIDDSVFDLLEKLLEPRISKRPTAQEALNHPFFHDL